MVRLPLYFLFLLLMAPVAAAAPAAPAGTAPVDKPDPAALQFFETKVRPLLAEKCLSCHDGKKHKGDLRLDSREAILEGGTQGPAIVPGEPGDSLLVRAVSYEDEDLQMPPKTKLSDEQIAVLSAWVKLGAPWPADAQQGGPAVRSRSAKISDEDRAYWFFQPLREAAPPALKGAQPVSAIDAFLLARLQAVGLSYAARAERTTLIRRATFDLHGLPPTPVEIEAFLRDDSTDAYENLIDRLLASPRYGERQARLWLDVVRYADSDGFKADDYRPHIWRYRDWVISAFNDDLPYDKFVTLQLAGDEAGPGDPDAITATGYLRLGPYEYNQRDVHKQWNEIIDDITGNVGEVFMGLSMHCARCHNHKFDPILQEDYFKLRAVFAAVLPDDSLTAATPQERTEYEKKLAAWHETTKELREKIEAIEGPVRAAVEKPAIDKFGEDLRRVLNAPPQELSPLDQQIRDLAYRQIVYEHKNIPGRIKGEKRKELDALHAELRKHEALKPAPLTAVMAMRDVGAVAPPTVIPGDRSGRVIEPGFLSVLPPQSSPVAADLSGLPSTGRRLAFARWLTRPENAMTSRVMVNRIWQQHFGAGIVATGNDFGRQGETPTHPQLLDHLARQFVDQGWSIKRLHKSIMLSAAYQQASVEGTAGTADRAQGTVRSKADPDNRLLSRYPLRRLDGEQIRDAMLFASGELDLRMGGAGVDPSLPRRGVYLKYMRNNRPDLIEIFDGPDAFNSISKRNVTTIAPQALMLINGDWALARARHLAEAARKESGGDAAKMVAIAYRRALGRAPSAAEARAAADFLRVLSRPSQAPQPIAATSPPASDPAEQAKGVAIDFRRNPFLRMKDRKGVAFEEFTLEATFMLKSIDGNASVRTIASQWDGNPEHAGWSIGVTGRKSKFQPQTIIVQLVGINEEGQRAYDVVVSGLKPQLDQLYHLVVSVKLSEVDSTGITFHLKPLAVNAEPVRASVGHTAIKGIDNDRAFVIGGRDDGKGGHGFDGLLDDVRLYSEALGPQQLVGGRSPRKEALIGDWRFDAEDGFLKDFSGRGNHLTSQGAAAWSPAADAKPPAPPASPPTDPAFAAFIDFCHVLLNTNEFLYID